MEPANNFQKARSTNFEKVSDTIANLTEYVKNFTRPSIIYILKKFISSTNVFKACGQSLDEIFILSPEVCCLRKSNPFLATILRSSSTLGAFELNMIPMPR